jgi:hypothetical protein
MYSSTHSLTSALDGVGGQRHASAVLPRERDPVSIVQEAGWAAWQVSTVGENLAPPGMDPRTFQSVAIRYHLQ